MILRKRFSRWPEKRVVSSSTSKHESIDISWSKGTFKTQVQGCLTNLYQPARFFGGEIWWPQALERYSMNILIHGDTHYVNVTLAVGARHCAPPERKLCARFFILKKKRRENPHLHLKNLSHLSQPADDTWPSLSSQKDKEKKPHFHLSKKSKKQKLSRHSQPTCATWHSWLLAPSFLLDGFNGKEYFSTGG